MLVNSIKTKNNFHNYIVIKQSDNTSAIEILLCGANGSILSDLNQSCTLTILDEVDQLIRQKTTEQIVNGTVTFRVTNDLKTNTHTLEITTADGQKFPSNHDFKIFVSYTHDESELIVINNLSRDEALAEIDQSVKRFISENTSEYVDKVATSEWLNANEFKVKQPVSTKTLLPAEAELKELRLVVDENKQYIFNGLDWVVFGAINANGLDVIKEEFNTKVNNIMTNLMTRGVLATSPPEGYTACVGDGLTDDTVALQTLIDTFSYVLLPPGTYKTTNRIRLGRNGKQLIGLTETVRGYAKTATLKYDGEVNNKMPVVLMGTNEVGAEPTIDCTNNQLKNVFIDCNYKAGFGVYGTYLTNETEVINNTVKGSLEYNMFFAKGWYGSIQHNTSLNCKNNGISIGLPLVYSDGTEVLWTSANPLEMNNLFIRELRSLYAGEQFSVDKQNIFKPNLHYKRGFGIGIGHGYALNVDDIISEKSGGVNLYSQTGSALVKSIENIYLEKPCFNSGLSTTEAVQLFIENISDQGGMYEIKDMFASLEGGIMFKGAKRKVKLVNVFSPTFLKSWNDEYDVNTLYNTVLKENVYYRCGYHNFDESEFTQVYRGTHDTRYSFFVPFMENNFKYRVVYVKLKSPSDKAIGSMIWRKADNTYQAKKYPSDINANTFVFSHIQSGSYVNFEKGGITEVANGNVEFLIYEIPVTWT